MSPMMWHVCFMEYPTSMVQSHSSKCEILDAVPQNIKHQLSVSAQNHHPFGQLLSLSCFSTAPWIWLLTNFFPFCHFPTYLTTPYPDLRNSIYSSYWLQILHLIPKNSLCGDWHKHSQPSFSRDELQTWNQSAKTWFLNICCAAVAKPLPAAPCSFGSTPQPREHQQFCQCHHSAAFIVHFNGKPHRGEFWFLWPRCSQTRLHLQDNYI